MTATSSTFRAGVAGPQRLPRITAAEINANLEKVREHPGEWCDVATFGSKSSASNRATRIRDAWPDLIITSSGNKLIARTKKGSP